MHSTRVRCAGLILAAFIAWVLASGCSKGKAGFTPPPKKDPETELTYAPVQYDTTTFRVHFFWTGFDDDGEVKRFHFAVDTDTLRPPGEWPTTTSKDTTLLFQVDPIQELKVHVFKVAAEDNEGRIDRTPASRAFSAKTLPPHSQINKGPSGFNLSIGPNFTFEWSGIDPDGGETGGKVPVDTFQYMLLRVGGIADLHPGAPYDPLPPFEQNLYVGLIDGAIGDGLPAGDHANLHNDHSDWKWIGIRALKLRFRNVTPGEYVFTERAVDIAGATEKGLGFPTNIRHFTVTNRNSGPVLTVRSSILNRPLPSATGPDDFARKELQVFEGETVSFSWSANADAYGGEIEGYTYALDDTSSFPGLDVRQTAATFSPSKLTVGSHFLYVRAVDDGGLVTNLVQPLKIVHPAFKDPGAPRSILFVDDSVVQLGNRSGPNDQVETNWWTLRGSTGHGPLTDLTEAYGVVNVEEWDTTERALGSVEGRKQPAPSDLAPFTTVVWTTDASNGGSISTALFRTVAGGDYSELQGYLRAGGTLILTGWNIAQNTSGFVNDTYKVGGPAPNGICTFPATSDGADRTVFPRMYMGIANSVPSLEGKRLLGAYDFVRGIPTAAGAAMGFDTARVDTGNLSFGVQFPGIQGDPTPTFKWNTKEYPPPFVPDEQLFPGLSGIEGWIMSTNFGCIDDHDLGREVPSSPVARPIYTYHGVRTGVLQDGTASPREGLVCASLVQSHDLGINGGHYDAKAAIGRIAIFTFPLYFLRDADAIDIMKKSYLYVSTSPTLP